MKRLKINVPSYTPLEIFTALSFIGAFALTWFKGDDRLWVVFAFLLGLMINTNTTATGQVNPPTPSSGSSVEKF